MYLFFYEDSHVKEESMEITNGFLQLENFSVASFDLVQRSLRLLHIIKYDLLIQNRK